METRKAFDGTPVIGLARLHRNNQMMLLHVDICPNTTDCTSR